MNIYLIKRNNGSYDEYHAHVIIANNTAEVIYLASVNCCDEGKEVWKTATISVIGKYTGNNKKPFILLSDYYAG